MSILQNGTTIDILANNFKRIKNEKNFEELLGIDIKVMKSSSTETTEP